MASAAVFARLRHSGRPLPQVAWAQAAGDDGPAPCVMGQSAIGEASVWGYFLGLFFCWSSQNFLSLNGVSLEDVQPQNPQLAMGLGFGRLGV